MQIFIWQKNPFPSYSGRDFIFERMYLEVV